MRIVPLVTYRYFLKQMAFSFLLAFLVIGLLIPAGIVHAQHKAWQSEIAHTDLNALHEAEQIIYSHPHDEYVIYTTLEPCVMCLGAIVMSNINSVVFTLADHWMKPQAMLDLDFLHRHIRRYFGGILENQSVKLREQYFPGELPLILHGKRVN